MKKIVIIISSIIGIIAIGLFIFITVMQSGLTGKWDLVSGDEECFTQLNFTDGPSSARVISFDEVIGNSKQVFMGPVNAKDNTLSIEVTNFDNIDPFDMNYELNNNQLVVKYPWENNEYTCTYEEVE